MPPRKEDTTVKSIQAGLLSWLLPGAGHFLLGHRGLGILFFIAISFPYWTGLAFGGIKDSVNPWTNRWLFLAEMGAGGYTLPCALACRSIERHIADCARAGTPVKATDYSSYYPELDVAQIYLAAAGLLNVLVILDAVSRAQTGGLPTFYHELPAAARSEGGP